MRGGSGGLSKSLEYDELGNKGNLKTKEGGKKITTDDANNELEHLANQQTSDRTPLQLSSVDENVQAAG